MRFFRLIVIAAIIYGVFVEGRAWKRAREQSALVSSALSQGPEAAVELGIPANCSGKQYCITVFVAPWCPVCTSSEPSFIALQKFLPESRPDVGFGIVVGSGKPEEHQKEKERLAPIEVVIDESGRIMKARQIQAFPTWIVNASTGKELKRKASGLKITNESQLPGVLKDFLGL